ncbi:MAG: sialidase family protein [Candidatus Omnitrophota bacterium]
MTFLSVVFLISFLNLCFAEEPAPGKPFWTMVCPPSQDNPRNSEGDIVVLKDGTLLLAWSRFTGSADHASAVVAAKKSQDGGLTWGNEFILQENTGMQNVMSVSFLRLRSGAILFFYLQKNGPDDLHLFVRKSADDAKTWTSPIKASTQAGYNIMNNARAIQLSTGRILAPIAFTPDISKDYNNQVDFCYYSDDEGETWKKGKGEAVLEGSPAMEPGLVEMKDGVVMMIIRTRLNRIYRALSRDGGETWSQPQATELTAPASPSTISRIPQTGDLLLVWNNNPLGDKAGWRGRSPLTAAVSRDESQTWEHVKNIEDDPDSCYAYTSITWLNNRALLTYYHWRKGEPNFQMTGLVFHSIPVGWFYEK